MPNFKPHNYDQTAMIVVNFEEQLALDPFALTLHHLIENSIDLTVFYEKYNFSARVAWSYADRQIYSLGSNVLNDIYRNPRGQYDVQLRYRISSRYSITGSVRNVTREKEQFSYGVNGLVRTSRLLDRDYKLGLGFNF